MFHYPPPRYVFVIVILSGTVTRTTRWTDPVHPVKLQDKFPTTNVCTDLDNPHVLHPIWYNVGHLSPDKLRFLESVTERWRVYAPSRSGMLLNRSFRGHLKLFIHTFFGAAHQWPQSFFGTHISKNNCGDCKHFQPLLQLLPPPIISRSPVSIILGFPLTLSPPYGPHCQQLIMLINHLIIKILYR